VNLIIYAMLSQYLAKEMSFDHQTLCVGTSHGKATRITKFGEWVVGTSHGKALLFLHVYLWQAGEHVPLISIFAQRPRGF
jgi:hypothetical protein